MRLAGLKWKAEELVREIGSAEQHCLNCKQSESIAEGGLYRCWDCKQMFCGPCIRDHFGNHHQPHPYTRTQVRIAIKGLVKALRDRCGKEFTDDEAAALFRSEEALKCVPPEDGEVP